MSLQIDQRVRLKHSHAGMYPFASGGAEGFVRKESTDKFHYEMVFIEWDKAHWRYEGENDMWTYASHFEPVEESAVEEKTPEELFAEFLEWQAKQKAEPENTMAEGVDKVEDKPKIDRGEGYVFTEDPRGFNDVVTEAMDALLDSESFILVTVNKREVGSSEAAMAMIAPESYTAYANELSARMAEAHLAQLSSRNFVALVADLLHEHTNKPYESGR